jgi:TetR/AcrR family transcriptional regulator
MDSFAADRPATVRSGIAERLWDGARNEFSLRGYHGARVQGIARRAGCNVALLYRHWSSKKALYLDVLRAAWQSIARELDVVFAEGGGPSKVVQAYLDAHLSDPVRAQLLVREILDGGPFLSQLLTREPGLLEPVRRASQALAPDASHPAPPAEALRPGLDATLSVLCIGGLAALVASAHGAARPFFAAEPPSLADWRRNLQDLLLHGVAGPAT